jgi:hypothetical protein
VLHHFSAACVHLSTYASSEHKTTEPPVLMNYYKKFNIVSQEASLNASARSTDVGQPDLEVADDTWDLDCGTDEHPDS